MKHICTRCERYSEDGNLWCQEIDCPAEEMPIVFGYGQILGDVKILRLLTVLRTATIYEAERSGRPLLLKVAHQGCEDQLRREADVLCALQKPTTRSAHPLFPLLLPAFAKSSIQYHPYGKAQVHDHTIYYEVFEFIDGQTLRNLLNETPQPWYEHAAWLVITVADAITFLHRRAQRLHFSSEPRVYPGAN